MDAIKVDTQGSELEILEGAKETLRSVNLIEIEVTFNPKYDGQPLFAEVDQFLRSQGFVLWKFSSETHYSSANVPGLQ